MKLKYRVIVRFRGKYSIDAMCRAFEVSRSGYYAWRNRQAREAKDQWLTDLIMDCQQRCKQTYGCRECAAGFCVRPDITYIPTAKGMLYLCAEVDLCGKMVLSYRIGNDMTASLVTDTIRDALQKEKVAGGLALHSDQGSQYTGTAFRAKLNAAGMIQSMSRVGRCIDNGPMEAFWGTLKAEMYYLHGFLDYDSLKVAIEQYIYFYNNNRYQVRLDGLAPMEYRIVLQTAA